MRQRRSRKGAVEFVFTVFTIVALTTSAWAQSKGAAFQVEQFEPLPAPQTNLGNLAGSAPLGHLAPSFGLTLHLVDDPIEVRTNGDTTTKLVDDQLKAELLAAAGLFGWADVGVAIPVVLLQSADDLTAFGNPDGVRSFGIADIRVVPRVRMIKPEWAGGVGVAFLLPLYLPTGGSKSFNGEGSVRVEPRLAADWSHDVGLRVLANLGYQVRSKRLAVNYVSDDVVRWGLGLEAPVGLPMLRATAALYGSASVSQGRDPEDLTIPAPNRRAQPVEAQLGLRATVSPTVLLTAGAGFGLTASVGSPDFRVIAGVAWAPTIDVDADKDGIKNAVDACRDQAEDIDGWEDDDGCPDFDNDDDGLLDADDKCPDFPEDRDGFEDSDGCPDADNDADGILDFEDRCPDEAGPPDLMGCAPEDSDGDGKYDHEEACPADAEDMDGFEDEDGCPEVDNDFDGLLDDVDACPLEAEVYNGRDDADGCPDAPASTIRPTATGIELLESIDFGSGTKLRSRGRAVLDQVATAITNNAWAPSVRIEAYAADDAPKSLAQAQERAAEVHAYLVTKGVDAGRLEVAAAADGGEGAARIELVYVTADAVDVAPEEPDEKPDEEEEPDGFDFSGGDQ